MRTYSYREITEATESIIIEELSRAEKETDRNASAWHRGIAVGAWRLWQEATKDEMLRDTLEDTARFRKLLGISDTTATR